MAIVSKTDRHGVDIVIENLQQRLYSRLLAHWDSNAVYASYPRANKNYRESREGDTNIVPEISLDQKNYKETLMDDKVSVNSFWLVDNDRDYDTNQRTFTHTISVIFQANLDALYGQSNRADEEFNINVLNELEKTNPYYNDTGVTMIETVDSVYSDLSISGEMKEIINFHDIGKLHVVRFDFEVKYKSSCGISNLAPVCPIITETFNGASITSPVTYKTIIVQSDASGNPQTGIITEDTAESLIITVPAAGGDPVENQVNGDSKIDIPSGGSKNFIIQDTGGTPVTVTQVSDSATEFVGEVSVTGDIFYNVPQPTYLTVYNTGDEPSQRISGVYDNTIPSNGRLQVLANGNFYKIQFDKENRGHLYRFLGFNGGYYNSDDGLYYDSNDVVTTRALVFDDDNYAFDRLTGIGWWTITNGAASIPAAYGFISGYSYLGFTDWKMPFNDQFESIIDPNLPLPLYASSSPIFDMQGAAKSSTPYSGAPTTSGWQLGVDGRINQRTYSLTDQIFICRDARGQF